METLKESIFNTIKTQQHVSFAELQRDHNIGGGEFALEARPNSNIFFWVGLNEEGITAIQELLQEKKIFMHPTDTFVYMIDGSIPRMELVKSNRNYKKPRWAPITFCTYPVKTQAKAKKAPSLPRMKFREDMQAYEVHYLSPNKAKRMNSITVSTVDFSKDKAFLIATFLHFRASNLKDDPMTVKGIKSGSRITEDCQNDKLMQDAKEAVIKFLSNFN